MIQNEEFINEFVEEAQSHLEIIEAGLLRMEEGSNDTENVNTIFRSIHSIKGTAGFFGLDKVVELAHVMENLLGEMRNNNIEPTSQIVDHLLGGNDQLKSMVGDVFNSDAEDVSELVTVFSALLNEKKSLPEAAVSQNAPEADTASEVEQLVFPSTSADQKQEQIKEARKHGHYLYKVTIGINRDIGSQDLSPVKFFKRIQSVGDIVDSFIDMSQVKGLKDVLSGDAYFTFIFTTVLEKKLLPIALDIQEENFQELDTYSGGGNENTNPDQENLVLKKNAVAMEQTWDTAVEAGVLPSVKEGQTPAADLGQKLEESAVRNEATTQVEDSIRVHVSLLNDLLNLASEMVLGRNQLLRSLDDHRKEIHGLDPILQNIDRVTTDLQEKIMQTRMQPVGNVFNKMPRVIRDLSKKLGKEVNLNIVGSHVELDKSIIESLSDPLTHLIRNAVDHGLENPEKRKKAGKSSEGKAELKAYHEGGYVHIDIIDDGAGIDAERIKTKGIEKGLVTEQEAKQMGEQEILQLLMKPGFSTAEKVTDVSGRGVGMDVVKTNIQKLGGTIEIQTKLGEGTTFRLVLPLTLAIIPSLIVEVANHRFALPQVNLQEMVRIKAGDDSKKVEFVHNAKVLRLRGKLLPVVDLGEVLGLERQRNRLAVNTSQVTRILVLKVGSKRFGLVVDSIHDEEEILVKPLPSYFKSCQCYSGVTIMGDGKTAMILDPDGIISKANLRFSEDLMKPSDRELAQAGEEMKEQQNILMFKCSGEETFAIDLSLVSRVEEISINDIEAIGDKEFIKHRGEALRVIRPENYLPVSKAKNLREKLYVIIPKLVAQPIGLIIEKIHDTVMTTIKLNQEDIRAKGLIGSTILSDRIVLLINIYEIFEMVSPEEYEDATLKSSGNVQTILLAEDTPFFARLSKNYLEWAGYRVIMAGNGREALELLREHPVDLVLSDIQMPEMDGLELARSIRKNPDLASIPLVALTSMTGEKDRQAGMEAGFDFYEFKLDKITILEVLKKALLARRNVV